METGNIQLIGASGFAELSLPQQKAHRAKIGVKAKAILSQFWQDTDTPDAIQALEIEGWIDVLQECSHSEINSAWEIYQKGGPRSAKGRLYKPDAGFLWRMVEAARELGWPQSDPAGFIEAAFAPVDHELEEMRARYRRIKAEGDAAVAAALAKREGR